MEILFKALIDLLVAAAPTAPVSITSEDGAVRVHLGHISDIENPTYPAITLMQQGGESVLPVAGAENPNILVQVWSRKNGDEAIHLYEWVSKQINQRHYDISAQMVDGSGNRTGVCLLFVRVFRSEPLFDELMRVWYASARYYAKVIDYSDLHAAFGAAS